MRWLASEVHVLVGGVVMGDKVRRVRLLVAVGVAGLLALVAAWPSQVAATETPPLYLARGWSSGGSPAVNMNLVVGDGPRLAAHLLADGEDPATVQVIDSTGRVVILGPDGKVQPTERVLEPALVQSWLGDSFTIRARGVRAKVTGDAGDKVCSSAKASALKRLDLPTHEGTRTLTLAETLTEADRRIAAMHQPANQIPPHCVVAGDPHHRAGYLHNLWHRITGP